MGNSARIRAGAVVAGAIVVALALWLILSSNGGNRQSNGAAGAGSTPMLFSKNGLIGLVDTLDTPVYWVGPRANVGYEVTETSAGRTYVRYLPPGVHAGDPRPDFLTVGTYQLSNPMAAMRNAGHERGGETVHLKGGTVVFMNRSKPTSAFIVGRGWKDQVEVYDPSPDAAMKLVLAGDVQPVR